MAILLVVKDSCSFVEGNENTMLLFHYFALVIISESFIVEYLCCRKLYKDCMI